MPLAGVDDEEVAGAKPDGSAGVYVVEASRGDEHQLGEFVVVHGYRFVARRVVHLAHDARKPGVLEVLRARQTFEMRYLRHAADYTKNPRFAVVALKSSAKILQAAGKSTGLQLSAVNGGFLC